jgi:hypothetical protein
MVVVATARESLLGERQTFDTPGEETVFTPIILYFLLIKVVFVELKLHIKEI